MGIEIPSPRQPCRPRCSCSNRLHLALVPSAALPPNYNRFTAMFAPYILSSSIRLSVCLSATSWCIETTGQIELFFGRGGFFSVPSIRHCVIRKFGYLQSQGTSPCVFLPNSRLRKFRRRKSIALSTKLVVVVVDGRAC